MTLAAVIAREVLATVVRDLGPPPHPVRFRVRLPADGLVYGSVTFKDGKRPHYMVELREGLTEAMLRETIVHELAHIYAWIAEGVKFRNTHDAFWGVAYARVYCAAFGVS